MLLQMAWKRAILFALLLQWTSFEAQNPTEKISTYVNSYVEKGDFQGCVLIIEKDEVLFKQCWGQANKGHSVKNIPQTKFKIGSISKQFTAAAILRLEELGKLSTNDDLTKYFPDWPSAKKISIQQLLTHTSGVTDIFNIPDFSKLSYEKSSISDLSKLLLEMDLDFEAGTQYSYSNGGYALLAHIIEKQSGLSYQDFLTEQFFKPLKMINSGHAIRNEVVVNLAEGYDPLGFNDVKITDFVDPELLKGSGSLYSTVGDLHLWIQSLKNKTLLSESSYDKFFKNYGRNYGYGISVYQSFEQSVFGHDGRINGFIADYLHYREPDISIIILGNVQTGVADFLRRDLAALVFDKDYKSKANTIPAALNSERDTSSILGTYAFGPNFKVYVENLDNSVQARANEGSYSELVLLNDGRYFSRTLYSYIEFIEGKNGEITKMLWTNNDGNTFTGLKE